MDYQASTYGDLWAEVYDEVHHELSDPAHVDPIVDVLVELAGTGRALELGIGTGRIALPLANRGVEVHGIDFSKAMVEKLHQKPGGCRNPGRPRGLQRRSSRRQVLAHLRSVQHILWSTDSRKPQVRCFQNVARHLANRGVFLIEAFVPDATRFNRGQNVSAQSVEIDRCRLSIERHNPVHQIVDSCHLILSKDDVRLMPIKLRYAWPAELDLMARIAGMRLRHRWSNWPAVRLQPPAPDTSRHTNYITTCDPSRAVP